MLKREEEMKMQIMDEVMEKYKELKAKKQSQQKAIEEAEVRITDLSVASLFQRFYPQMHRNIQQNPELLTEWRFFDIREACLVIELLCLLLR